MKKNVFLRRALVSAVACSTIFASTAFAKETLDATKLTEATKVEETEKTEEEVDATKLEEAKETEAKEEEVKEEEAKFVVYAGKVASVVEGENGLTVTLENKDNGGIIANLAEDTSVIDAGDVAGLKKVSDIKEGMEVSLIIPSNSPMALSYPPQTSSVELVVIGSEKGNFEVAEFNDELVNKANTLKLNLAKDTKIVDVKFEEEKFTKEDLANNELVVFYTATTRSIPAQTTPSLIVVLEAEEVETPVEKPEVEEPKLVALRETFEGLGFEVKWTSNESPVILEKEGAKIEVKVGDSKATINGEVKTLKLATKLEDGKMFVSDEVIADLK